MTKDLDKLFDEKFPYVCTAESKSPVSVELIEIKREIKAFIHERYVPKGKLLELVGEDAVDVQASEAASIDLKESYEEAMKDGQNQAKQEIRKIGAFVIICTALTISIVAYLKL